MNLPTVTKPAEIKLELSKGEGIKVETDLYNTLEDFNKGEPMMYGGEALDTKCEVITTSLKEKLEKEGANGLKEKWILESYKTYGTSKMRQYKKPEQLMQQRVFFRSANDTTFTRKLTKWLRIYTVMNYTLVILLPIIFYRGCDRGCDWWGWTIYGCFRTITIIAEYLYLKRNSKKVTKWSKVSKWKLLKWLLWDKLFSTEFLHQDRFTDIIFCMTLFHQQVYLLFVFSVLFLLIDMGPRIWYGLSCCDKRAWHPDSNQQKGKPLGFAELDSFANIQTFYGFKGFIDSNGLTSSYQYEALNTQATNKCLKSFGEDIPQIILALVYLSFFNTCDSSSSVEICLAFSIFSLVKILITTWISRKVKEDPDFMEEKILDKLSGCCKCFRYTGPKYLNAEENTWWKLEGKWEPAVNVKYL